MIIINNNLHTLFEASLLITVEVTSAHQNKCILLKRNITMLSPYT